MAGQRGGKRPGAGRKLELTEAAIVKIVEALRAGNGRETAARLADVHPRTLRGWLKKAERSDDELLQRLAASVDKAEADGEAAMVKRIVDGDERWQSAAWFLERKYPDRWGRRDRLDVTHDVRRYVEQYGREAGLPDDEIEAAIAEAEAIATGHRAK